MCESKPRADQLDHRRGDGLIGARLEAKRDLRSARWLAAEALGNFMRPAPPRARCNGRVMIQGSGAACPGQAPERIASVTNDFGSFDGEISAARRAQARP